MQEVNVRETLKQKIIKIQGAELLKRMLVSSKMDRIITSGYIYDGKMVMHVSAHFDLPGITKCCSAWKLWLNGNSGYSCTDLGEETITAPIRPFMNFTVDSIREKLWKNFKARRKTYLSSFTYHYLRISTTLSNRGDGCKYQAYQLWYNQVC